MRNLPKSTAADDTESTLAVNDETRTFTVGTGWWMFSINGTWDSATVTLKVSSNGLPSGTFREYAVKDEAGTLTDQTFTDDIHHVYLSGGDCFRFDVTGAGTTDLDIKVAPGPGNSILIHPAI